MTTQQIRDRIYGMAEAASNDWYRRQCQTPYSAMYLYYKPGEIAFWIGEEGLNEDWQLADNQRISPAWTKGQVCRHVCDLAQRLPILSETD